MAPNRGLVFSLVGIYLERQTAVLQGQDTSHGCHSRPKSASRSHGLRDETRREPGSRRGLLASNQPLPSHWGGRGEEGRRYTSAGFKRYYFPFLRTSSSASREYTSDQRQLWGCNPMKAASSFSSFILRSHLVSIRRGGGKAAPLLAHW